MKKNPFFKVILQSLKENALMCACLFAAVIGSVVFALLPPLVLAKAIDYLTAGQTFPFALALSYFGLLLLTNAATSLRESLLTIFDVPEKDRDNYFVKTLGVPAGISFEDTDETERHVEREGISIIYSGRTLKPIRTTRGLVFIESRYLSPVADVLDVLELYERRTAEGTPYIVAKAGFLLQAVIMPYDVINQQFVESLQDLTRECEFSLSEKERREREARDRFTFTEPEQCSLNVDPDTGEVVEESEVADNA